MTYDWQTGIGFEKQDALRKFGNRLQAEGWTTDQIQQYYPDVFDALQPTARRSRDLAQITAQRKLHEQMARAHPEWGGLWETQGGAGAAFGRMLEHKAQTAEAMDRLAADRLRMAQEVRDRQLQDFYDAQERQRELWARQRGERASQTRELQRGDEEIEKAKRFVSWLQRESQRTEERWRKEMGPLIRSSSVSPAPRTLLQRLLLSLIMGWNDFTRHNRNWARKRGIPVFHRPPLSEFHHASTAAFMPGYRIFEPEGSVD